VSKQIEVRSALVTDLVYVGDNLREADFEEYVMSTGRHPSITFAKELYNIEGLRCGVVDGKPAAIFGCYKRHPWFLGTSAIEGVQVGMAMRRIGNVLFPEWYQERGELSNYVLDTNELHKKYIKSLGATLSDKAETRGPFNALFRKFTYNMKGAR